MLEFLCYLIRSQLKEHTSKEDQAKNVCGVGPLMLDLPGVEVFGIPELVFFVSYCHISWINQHSPVLLNSCLKDDGKNVVI